MTVDDFCGKIGISRQKFYRFAKEPRRFSQQNIRSIIEVLSLDESEILQLQALLRPGQQNGSAVDLSDCYRLVSKLIRRRLSEELSQNLKNIEYTDSGNAVTIESPKTLARIIADFGEDTEGEFRDFPQKAGLPHSFLFTIYNCISPISDNSTVQASESSGSILTITRLIRELEDVLSAKSACHIRVRHYLPDDQQKMLLENDLQNKEAMLYNLHLLNCVLPLLSLAEDYSISLEEVPKKFWTNHTSFCLIRHSCTVPGSLRGNVQDEVYTEYYVLAFSNKGDCCACRLGSGEAAHVYRFLSADSPEKGDIAIPSKTARDNPNQVYGMLNQEYRLALIHPDLCFDDIPREMWMALYREVEQRKEKAVFKEMFRSLMDPYDQYSFLSFEDLVKAAISTLELRSSAAGRKGKMVICHPAGLADMAKTGIITDLYSDSFDYTGKGQTQVPLRFPDSIVRQMLQLVTDNIRIRRASADSDPLKSDRLNYYVLNPKFPYPEISFIIYRDRGVAALYKNGRHKNTISNIFPNPAIGTLLFNYVTEEMIGRRGTDLESDILSDDHSLTLVEQLIAQIDIQQDKADEQHGSGSRPKQGGLS